MGVIQPCKMEKIRAGRPKPGLSNQHLAGVNLVSELTGAKIVDEADQMPKVGTCTLFISPPTNPNQYKNEYEVDAKTAGSIGLIGTKNNIRDKLK